MLTFSWIFILQITEGRDMHCFPSCYRNLITVTLISSYTVIAGAALDAVAFYLISEGSTVAGKQLLLQRLESGICKW